MTAPLDPEGIILAVFTDGRSDYMLRTMASYDAEVTGPISRVFIFDDSADTKYARWLEGRWPDAAVLSSGRRRGFAGNIARAWDILRGSPERWVFHLEDDFTFNRPVDLGRLARLMDDNPDVAQVALVRQAWNDTELAAGGVIEAARERGFVFVQGVHGPDPYLMHRAFWTTNPSLYPTTVCRLGWPDESESEGKFSIQLLGADPVARFAYWGTGEPWVTHIGRDRVGIGY